MMIEVTPRDISRLLWFIAGSISIQLKWWSIPFILVIAVLDMIQIEMYKYKPVQRKLDEFEGLW